MQLLIIMRKSKFNYSELMDNISLEVAYDKGVTDEVIECLLSMTNSLPDKY